MPQENQSGGWARLAGVLCTTSWPPLARGVSHRALQAKLEPGKAKVKGCSSWPKSSPYPKPPGHAHGISSLLRTLSTGPPSDQGQQPGALSGVSGYLGRPYEALSKGVSNFVLCVLLHIHICLVFTTAMRNQ